AVQPGSSTGTGHEYHCSHSAIVCIVSHSYEIHREPSSCYTSHHRKRVHKCERQHHTFVHDSILRLQVCRQPEKEEPPNPIGHEFAKCKCPCLTITEEFRPG